jgi:hypothetical protein
MKKGVKTKRKGWIKLCPEKWIFGSTREEMTPAQRAVWVDFLALAYINDPPGQINFTSFRRLANQLYISRRLLTSTIKAALANDKIQIIIEHPVDSSLNKKIEKINSTQEFEASLAPPLVHFGAALYTIFILKWNEYQSEYLRQKPYREKDSESNEESQNLPPKFVTQVTDRGDKRRKKEIRRDNTSALNENRSGQQEINTDIPPDPPGGKRESHLGGKEKRPEFYELVDLLVELMLQNDPKAKVPKTESQRYKWARDFRLLVERDERPVVEVRKVLIWGQNDSFWKGNILSPRKFREKYPALRSKMIEEIKREQQFNQKERLQLSVGNQQPFTKEEEEKYRPQIKEEYEKLKQTAAEKGEDVDNPFAFPTWTEYLSRRINLNATIASES